MVYNTLQFLSEFIISPEENMFNSTNQRQIGRPSNPSLSYWIQFCEVANFQRTKPRSPMFPSKPYPSFGPPSWGVVMSSRLSHDRLLLKPLSHVRNSTRLVREHRYLFLRIRHRDRWQEGYLVPERLDFSWRWVLSLSLSLLSCGTGHLGPASRNWSAHF